MFEIVGKYNRAKIYASTVEQTAYSQIQNLLTGMNHRSKKHPFTEKIDLSELSMVKKKEY